MEEILSIVEKERFADCPLCNTPVSSNSPICKKCGLEMSSEGIIEMAEDKESRDCKTDCVTVHKKLT